MTCSVCTPEGAELDVDVVENEDGTFDIFYTAPQPGEYVICVRFGGEHIPNSPFQVTVSVGVPAGWVQGLSREAAAGMEPCFLNAAVFYPSSASPFPLTFPPVRPWKELRQNSSCSRVKFLSTTLHSPGYLQPPVCPLPVCPFPRPVSCSVYS